MNDSHNAGLVGSWLIGHELMVQRRPWAGLKPSGNYPGKEGHPTTVFILGFRFY